MAIYHLSTKIIGRSTGRTATAAAAYRAGIKIKDARSGLVFVTCPEIFGPVKT